MRIVADTNTIVSALMYGERNIARILHFWRDGKLDLLSSPALFNEIKQVLYRPKFVEYLNRNDINEFLELLQHDAIWVHPEIELHVVEDDPADNRVLELAITGRAEYVISGDGHLLNIGRYNGIFIVKPSVFINLITTSGT